MSPENFSGVLRHELERIDQHINEFNSKKQAIEKLLKAYSRGNPTGLHLVSQPEKSISTLEMAQEVLRKRGSEMKPEESRQAIRQQFSVEPAPTLAQMLYTRARAKKVFYRSPGGKFGLLASYAGGRHSGRKAA